MVGGGLGLGFGEGVSIVNCYLLPVNIHLFMFLCLLINDASSPIIWNVSFVYGFYRSGGGGVIYLDGSR